MEIREFTFADLDAFAVAHRQAFGFNLNIGDYLFKSAFGSERQIVLARIAVESDSIVSFYGVYKCSLINSSGKIINGAQSGDTLTVKSHRGQGLFVRLAKEVYNLCPAFCIDFVFGIPSDSSSGIFKNKLSWQMSQQIMSYRRFVPTIPISLFVNNFLFRRVYRMYENLILKFYINGKPFSRKSSGMSNYVTHRNEDFWKSKLGKEGVYLKKISGCDVIFKLKDGRLMIGDVDCSNELELKKVMKYICRLSALLGCSIVHFYFSDKSEFSKYSFFSHVKQGLPLGFLSLNEALLDVKIDLNLTFLDFDTF